MIGDEQGMLGATSMKVLVRYVHFQTYKVRFFGGRGELDYESLVRAQGKGDIKRMVSSRRL